MNIFTLLENQLKERIRIAYPSFICKDVSLEVPKDQDHGDLSSNIALVLKSVVNQNPKDIAENLIKHFKDIEYIEAITVAGPGFINFKIKNKLWYEVLEAIITLKNSYADSTIGKGEKVNVEFVSTNPTGPMHVGHARGAVFGDVLARLLKKCQFDVTKEYIINDAGSQILTLADSVFIRYKQALGMDEQIPEGMYPGEYLVPLANELKNIHKDSLLSMDKEQRKELLMEFSVTKMMELIKADLLLLDVKHDVFVSEKHELLKTNKIEQAIKLLEEKHLLYVGTLEPPKGKIPDDWEAREQTLFKATQFGDDVDHAIRKSDGSHTYFAADIAYHQYKLERGFNNMILVLGADHAGYTKRMKAIVAALSDNKATIDIKINQLVNLYKDGQPFKMSKRAGNFITVEEVVNEVGKDIIRFMMLTRKNDTVLDFDIEKVKEQSKDNPVFYVQYALARAHSVTRNAIEQKINSSDKVDLTLLISPLEIDILKKMAFLPKIIESSAIHHEPHRITYYLYELATLFHSFWSAGNEQENLRFIIPNNLELSKARLKLAQGLIQTITCGLDILGVTPIEQM